MQRNWPISLNVRPDVEYEGNLTQTVITAYTMAMILSRNERMAFDSAVRAWRARNPNASSEDGATAVASIICHKL
jgi:hypothetical protein